MAAVGQVMQGAVAAAWKQAAAAAGVDFDLLLKTAQRESSLDPNARAKTSSAAGLFQFIESTWLEMVGRHGARHGLGAEAAKIDLSGPRPRVADAETRAQILALRFDPELAGRLAGELTRENAAALQAQLGRAPSQGELYAAHVLGAGGAAKLIRAAEAGAPDAAALFPKEASANRGLFFDAGGAPRSAQGLLDRLTGAGGGGAAVAAQRAAFLTGPAPPEQMAAAMMVLELLGLDLFGAGEASAPELRLLARQAYGRERE